MQAPRPFRLYGAERSYFTGKVRPAFRAARLFVEEILPTPEVYREIRERTGLGFIPVVVTPSDATWQDTSVILDRLEEAYPERLPVPPGPVQGLAAHLVELYADEFMLLPAMHYRWSFPEGERDARGAFAALNGDRERADRFADRMKGSLPLLGVTEATAPAIEAHVAELLDGLEEILADQPFLQGGRPTRADFALLGPLYAHLYLDLVPGPMLRERAPRTAHWIERTNHPDVDRFGPLREGDTLHPGLWRLLDLIGRDAVPLLLDAVAAFEAWAAASGRPGATPPRFVGTHSTSLRGASVRRATSAYTPYMVGRVLDRYEALGPEGRAAADAAFGGTGLGRLLALRPGHRVGKRGFDLVLARGGSAARG